jgi:hypothetical protein
VPHGSLDVYSVNVEDFDIDIDVFRIVARWPEQRPVGLAFQS